MNMDFFVELLENQSMYCSKGKPKIASDLNGVTYINGDEGELTIKRSLQDWLDEMK